MSQVQAETSLLREDTFEMCLWAIHTFFRANVCESLIRSGISVFAMKIVKTRESLGAKRYDVIIYIMRRGLSVDLR